MTTARRTDPLFAPSPAPARLSGWLPDGTPHYAPVGILLVDGDRVCCHLCGAWFLSVASHLRAHGWTKAAYLEAFGLERSNSLAGPATHRRRSAAFAARQVSEPAIRRAQTVARGRARDGSLAVAAAAVNRGRAHPPQRRPKTLAALAAVRPEARAAGTAQRARLRLHAVATEAAGRFGFATVEAYLGDRVAAGLSLAAISREAGLHKDWMSRHLATVAPGLALDSIGPDRRDVRWRAVLARLGFAELAAYLRTRHLDEHHSVAAIAVEAGVSRTAVVAALDRHGVARTPHSAKRHRAGVRDREVAGLLGFDSLRDYVAARRAAGLTWSALSAESGLPASTLWRRGHA